MAHRTAIVGVGAALLVIGLTGLGLVQTGVVLPRGPGKPVAEKSSALPAAGAQQPQGALNQAQEQPGLIPKPSVSAPVPAARKSSAKSAPVRKTVPVVRHTNRAVRREAGPQTVRKSAGSARGVPPGFVSRRVRINRDSGLGALKASRRHVTTGRVAVSPVRAPARPVEIRFTFNPARDRPFGVASVHLGDKIRVNVERIGRVNRRVYFTFSRGLDSRRGAVLELRTMYSFERSLYMRGSPGYYVIHVRIYPDNRWRIMPRSLV